MKYQHIIAEVMSTPWAMRPEKLQSILSFIQFKAEGGRLSPNDIALIRETPREPYQVEVDPDVEFLEPLVNTYQISEIVLGADADGKPVSGTIEVIQPTPRIVPADDDELLAAAPDKASRSRAGAIAVLPLFGSISHRMGLMSEMSGGTSAEKFTQWFRAALNDPNVASIVIDVDSPGGTVHGVDELASEIFKARGVKPIVSVANAQSASAAYYIASQAGEFVVTPSGEVGSIGVFAAHEDISKAAESQGVKVSLISAGKFKTEANPFEPLSEEARAALQEKVNQYYDMFVSAVARGRNTTVDTVRGGFGQGRMLNAKAALAEGMVDRVATMDQTLRRLGAKKPAEKSLAAESSAVPVDAGNSPMPAQLRRQRELSLLGF